MRDTIERNKQKMYSTGEIAKLCGITVRTVQYYDQRGLLIPTELSEGGRRVYTFEDVEKLRLLIYLRSLGLSIDDIASIYQQDNGENIIKALIDERIFAIEKEVEEQKIKLQDAKSFREQLNAIPVITPASMTRYIHHFPLNSEYTKDVPCMIPIMIPIMKSCIR